MTPLLVVAVAVVAVLGAVKAWAGASFVRLFPTLALALVSAFIVFNKVGSPQYLTWIVVPVLVGLVIDRRRWRALAVLALVICALTQLVYPIFYGGLLAAHAGPAALLTARNVLMAALFVWSLVRLARVSRRMPLPAQPLPLRPARPTRPARPVRPSRPAR